MEKERLEEKEEGEGEFGELLRYTLTGYLGGLLLGGTLDFLGFQRSAIGQWLVRTISGEGESLLEGLFAFRRRIGGGKYGMAEAYGWYMERKKIFGASNTEDQN